MFAKNKEQNESKICNATIVNVFLGLTSSTIFECCFFLWREHIEVPDIEIQYSDQVQTTISTIDKQRFRR